MPKSPSDAFPENFVWGVATAAPQFEGMVFEDGKGESVWDRFARRLDRVLGGHTLEVACDHYQRDKQDFWLMSARLPKLGARWYTQAMQQNAIV